MAEKNSIIKNQIVKSLVAFTIPSKVLGTTNVCKTWVGLIINPSYQIAADQAAAVERHLEHSPYVAAPIMGLLLHLRRRALTV